MEGHNLLLERRYADSQVSRLPGFAQEFAARDFDVIVTTCTPSTRAARSATQRIPIVMVAVADPVGSALIKSLAQPGTNITGRSSQSNEIVAKMLSLFLRAAPRAESIAVLVNVNNIAHEPLWREAAQAALALKVDVRRVELRSAENPHGEDLPAAFARLSAAGARGVFMLPDDPISVINRARLVALAAQYRLPALYGASEFAEAGGLMSYGENLGDSAQAKRPPCRSAAEGRRPCHAAGGTADALRTGAQPEDRAGAAPELPAGPAAAGRSGDRVIAAAIRGRAAPGRRSALHGFTQAQRVAVSAALQPAVVQPGR